MKKEKKKDNAVLVLFSFLESHNILVSPEKLCLQKTFNFLPSPPPITALMID